MFFEAITTILLIIIPFLAYGARYLFNIMASHALTIEDYGDLTLALKTFGVFSAFILLGTATSAKRFLSEYMQQHDQVSSLHYIHWNLGLIAKFSLVFVTFLTTLCAIMLSLHFFNLKEISSYHLTFYLLFLAPFGALSALLASYLQCNGNNVLYNIFTQGGLYGVFAGLWWLLPSFMPLEYGNKTLWLLTLAVLVILNVLEIALVLYYFPFDFIKKICAFGSHAKSAVLSTWKKTAHRLIVNQLVFLILCAVDLYAVKFCTDSAVTLGQYSAVLTIGGVLWLLSCSIYSSMTASISYLLGKNDISGLQILVTKANIINFWVTTAAMIGIAVYGNAVLDTFGPHYATHESYTALIILTVGYYVGSFSRASTLLLSYSGNELYLVYGGFLELAVITVTAIAFTLMYGLIGAAVASTFTIVLKTFSFITVARQKTSIKSLSFM